jgi:hypothetical protein
VGAAFDVAGEILQESGGWSAIDDAVVEGLC